MKIKNFKKFVRSILIILGIIFISSLIIVKSTLSYTNYKYKTIYVKSGDTLWSIALDMQANNPYYKGKDVRYIISNLKEVNNLSNSMVYTNQELQIPII